MKKIMCFSAALVLAGCSSSNKLAPLNSETITTTDREAMNARKSEDAKSRAAEIAMRTVRSGNLEIYWERDTTRTHSPGIRGTITNHGNAPVRYQQIRLDYLDDTGRVIDTAFTIAVDHLELRAGESRKWSMPWTGQLFQISTIPISK
ncbi:FxLYD domain-containing protein [Oleiharenicola lentus]|uniref:FxLYD domain-containing protein n=1 Tax=Oleiharenicola lentus TaxID=2508720 RepID=UPI003F66D38D